MFKTTTITNTATRANGIQFQSSAYGRCIPLIYGTNRIAGNVIFYDDFVATPHTTESGGGGKGGGVKSSSTTYTYSVAIMIGLCEGAINNVGTIWIDKARSNLSESGLSFFNGSYSQIAWGYLTSKHPDKALAYRGTAFVSSGSLELGESPSLPNLNFEIYGMQLFNATDANPKDVLVDFLTNDKYGCGFPSSKMGDLTQFNNYCLANNILLSPMFDEQKSAADHIVEFLQSTNSSFVWSEGKLKVIPYGDSAATANGVTYTPNLTPIYDLTDDDFIDQEEPIKITRSANADAYNQIKIEFLNRANQYNAEISEAKDLANIDLYGLRASDTIQMHSVCSADTAKKIAQLILQRTLYIRNMYEFKVSWKYCLLEPMDLVTLTDSTLGLDKLAVRIVEIQEDDENTLTIRAEEFPFGIATATQYPSQTIDATPIDYYLSGGNVNTPVTFEPPLLLANNYEIWVGLNGGEYWGGADIWLSYDNETYTYSATATEPTRTGLTTTAMNSTDMIVRVDLSACRGSLQSTSEALAYIGGEVVKYSTATLVSAYTYDLTIIQRGLYSTSKTAHAIGSDFMRLDSSLVKIPFTTDMIGRTLYYKCLSYNLYGASKQSLADVNPFSFVIQGDLYPPAQVSGISYTLNKSGVQLKWSANTEIDITAYEVRGSDSGWGDGNYLWKGSATSTQVIQTGASDDYFVRAIDSLGNYSTSSASITVSISNPSYPTGLTAWFSLSSSSMAIVMLNWNAVEPTFGLDYYLVEYGSSSVRVNTTQFQAPADWVGNRNFSVSTVDKFGFVSSPNTISIQKLLPNSPTNFRAQVIDNNVLFYWNEPTATSLPVTSYELRRGTTWASASVIGKKSGAFTTVFESTAGQYTYWIASIDADNRYSSPVSIATTVAAPPDFILKAENTSNFSGTKSNAVIDADGSLLTNIDTTATWTSHFTSKGWTTPQNQIDAGYPIYIQPSVTPAYYEETVDLGTVLASSRVTINMSGSTVSGTITTSCDISLSADGSTWTDYAGVWQVYGTNFRYYKFKITLTGSDDKALYKITSINSVLDAKLRNDAGTATANASDVGGTVVNFNIQFIDVTSITVTPQGTTPLTALYDFTDTPNPTSFKVLLFNSSGSRVSGSVSWQARGY